MTTQGSATLHCHRANLFLVAVPALISIDMCARVHLTVLSTSDFGLSLCMIMATPTAQDS